MAFSAYQNSGFPVFGTAVTAAAAPPIIIFPGAIGISAIFSCCSIAGVAAHTAVRTQGTALFINAIVAAIALTPAVIPGPAFTATGITGRYVPVVVMGRTFVCAGITATVGIITVGSVTITGTGTIIPLSPYGLITVGDGIIPLAVNTRLYIPTGTVAGVAPAFFHTIVVIFVLIYFIMFMADGPGHALTADAGGISDVTITGAGRIIPSACHLPPGIRGIQRRGNRGGCITGFGLLIVPLARFGTSPPIQVTAN